jgi:asparagine synthase (glutamine-hydrolysing)
MTAFIAMAGESLQWTANLEGIWDQTFKAMVDRSGNRHQYKASDRFKIGFAGTSGGILEDSRFLCVYAGVPRMNGKPFESYFDIDVETLRSISGEFSLVLLDRFSGRLTLVKDRFGTHPLYYIMMPGGIVVSTECNSLIPFIEKPSINPPAMLEAIRFRWVVGKNHIIEPIKQVMSACVTHLDTNGEEISYRYWNIPFQPENGISKSLDEYSDDLHQAFRDFFKNRNLCDRKVGILLSGGVDSSVVAAVAKEQCPQAIAYVGQIPNDANEETKRAQFVANLLSMPCNVVDIDTSQFESDLRLMVGRLEEPPRNPNNLVLMQLYKKMAEDGIEVVLTGDAAEMLLGLADTLRISMFEKKRKLVRMANFPSLIKLCTTSLECTDYDIAWRIAKVLRQDTLEYALTLDEILYCSAIKKILISEVENWPMEWQFSMKNLFDQYEDFEEGLQSYQTYTFLQSSLIRHDRIARPLGLESTTPFLSEELVNVACKLPKVFKHTDRSRPILKNLCDRITHPEVTRWEKLGFPVPWHDWMETIFKFQKETFEDYGNIGHYLPSGFVEQAFNHCDYEALWTIMTLQILQEELNFKLCRKLSQENHG